MFPKEIGEKEKLTLCWKILFQKGDRVIKLLAVPCKLGKKSSKSDLSIPDFLFELFYSVQIRYPGTLRRSSFQLIPPTPRGLVLRSYTVFTSSMVVWSICRVATLFTHWLSLVALHLLWHCWWGSLNPKNDGTRREQATTLDWTFKDFGTFKVIHGLYREISF